MQYPCSIMQYDVAFWEKPIAWPIHGMSTMGLISHGMENHGEMFETINQIVTLYKTESSKWMALHVYKRKRSSIYLKIVHGWWFQALRKILVSWDDDPQYMEIHKSHVPNHQPDTVSRSPKAWFIENKSQPTWVQSPLSLYLVLIGQERDSQFTDDDQTSCQKLWTISP